MALLNRKRDTAPTEPHTAAEVETALASIDHERVALRAQLAGLAERERTLLDAEASDAELDALDNEKRRADRAMERLAAREKRLLTTARQLRDIEGQAMFAAFIERYRTTLDRVLDCFSAAANARIELIEVREEASKMGLERFLNVLPMPTFNAPMTHQWISHFSKCAVQELAALQPPTAEPPTFSVRFVKAVSLPRAPGRIVSGYRRDEIAAFPAAQALELVQTGLAVWVARPATQEDTP